MWVKRDMYSGKCTFRFMGGIAVVEDVVYWIERRVEFRAGVFVGWCCADQIVS